MVAVKVRRVDLEAAELAARDAELDDDPVEGLRVVAARLPAVVPRAGVREDAGLAYGRGRRREVLGRGEPFVGDGEDFGAEGLGDEVWMVGEKSG